MPVFNIAANTRDYSGTNPFYEGEAIRAGIRNSELRNELLEKEVGAFDDKLALDERRVGVYEESVDIQRQREERFRQEWEALRATDDGQAVEQSIAVSAAAYENAIATGKGDIEAREFAFETMLDNYDRAIEGGRKDAEEKLAAQGFTSDSFDPLKIRSFLGIVPQRAEAPGYKAKDTWIDSDGIERHGWYDDEGKFHKTDIQAKTPDGQDVKFSPPNSNEVEDAMALVKESDKLSDLSSKEKQIAARAIATEIRQIQSRFPEKGYIEAASMAVAGVEAKTEIEPSLIFGSETSLNLDASELADNEYLGPDGNIYVETEDGSFRRKD